MTATTVSTLELRVVERVLEMGGGYVLDFTDRQFVAFCGEFGVHINDARYQAAGTSKANRLRGFLRLNAPPLTGKVLAGLLQHRLASKTEGLEPKDLLEYRTIVRRLGGEVPENGVTLAPAPEAITEDELLRRVFQPELFRRLPLEGLLAEAMIERMNEASRCISVRAYLAAVILAGSVLEGMCLGFGVRHPAIVNRAYTEQFEKRPRGFHEWKLAEWIAVLGRLNVLTPNIAKFGHGLREFRNYVHPSEQLAHKFVPDEHTARIGFQVVIAAAGDFVRYLDEGDRGDTK